MQQPAAALGWAALPDARAAFARAHARPCTPQQLYGFTEDPARMLYVSDSTARYSRSKGSGRHAPGARWCYRSGATNVRQARDVTTWARLPRPLPRLLLS